MDTELLAIEMLETRAAALEGFADSAWSRHRRIDATEKVLEGLLALDPGLEVHLRAEDPDLTNRLLAVAMIGDYFRCQRGSYRWYVLRELKAEPNCEFSVTELAERVIQTGFPHPQDQPRRGLVREALDLLHRDGVASLRRTKTAFRETITHGQAIVLR